ncbi:hypothetical protein PROFUN_07241 [Planoprotostelium fungivorum]|uniref:Pentatricopeptide repeat-containing protein n=1 Tax=Planoprotostelium fungivorum TaxID=1890364 RepID=A0A2P6NM57_9EUKA|nr:hypothetical protein PROFUN_07241 [Planoprotostelium fungivorum]
MLRRTLCDCLKVQQNAYKTSKRLADPSKSIKNFIPARSNSTEKKTWLTEVFPNQTSESSLPPQHQYSAIESLLKQSMGGQQSPDWVNRRQMAKQDHKQQKYPDRSDAAQKQSPIQLLNEYVKSGNIVKLESQWNSMLQNQTELNLSCFELMHEFYQSTGNQEKIQDLAKQLYNQFKPRSYKDQIARNNLHCKIKLEEAMSLGQLDQAVQIFTDMTKNKLEITPQIYMLLMLCAQKQHRPELVLQFCGQLAQRYPNNTSYEAFKIVVDTLSMNGQNLKALQFFDIMLRNDCVITYRVWKECISQLIPITNPRYSVMSSYFNGQKADTSFTEDHKLLAQRMLHDLLQSMANTKEPKIRSAMFK